MFACDICEEDIIVFLAAFIIGGIGMKDEFNWDNMEGFQLKECYELAQQYEHLDIARDIIREKRKRVQLPDNYVPIQPNDAYPETDMQIVSDILYSLSLEGAGTSGRNEFRNAHKVSGITNIAEREFLLALLALRKGTAETQRFEALRHLEIANRYSPNDLRYITLINVILDVSK